jgi:hypothetical protein
MPSRQVHSYRLPEMVDFGSRRPERPIARAAGAATSPGGTILHARLLRSSAARQDEAGHGQRRAAGRDRKRGVLFDCRPWRQESGLAESSAARDFFRGKKGSGRAFLPDTISERSSTSRSKERAAMRDLLNVYEQVPGYMACRSKSDSSSAPPRMRPAAIRQDALGTLAVGGRRGCRRASESIAAATGSRMGRTAVRRDGTERLTCEFDGSGWNGRGTI